MKTLHAKLASQPAVITKRLYKLERSGRYEEALAEIREIWEDLSAFPDIEEFEPRTAAEILLRCGSLLGFFGHNKQIPGSQENSKNLLTEARTRFLAIYDLEKITECDNYLALAYWRTGERNEAETWIEEALSHDLPASSQNKIYAHLTRILIFLSAGRYAEIIKEGKRLEADFRKYGDAFLNGSFCTNYGLAHKNLGNISEALKYLELARFFHQRSQHKIYLGTVENNLAQLYKKEKRFGKAHEAIDSATQTFHEIKDKTREGFSLDTKAQVYLEEGKYAEALKTIEAAIKILQKSENLAYLVETYMTKAKALLYLDDFTAAVFCLFDAVQIAKAQISEAAAENLVKEFEAVLQEKNAPKEETLASDNSGTENFELVLPPALSHFTDIHGFWINNEHFEGIGLKKGSLAVVVRQQVERGDLTAIVETENDSVICGFYDSDFGIICLEGIDGEPKLFDENDVEILGKIVGVCHAGKNADGKMIVEELKL